MLTVKRRTSKKKKTSKTQTQGREKKAARVRRTERRARLLVAADGDTVTTNSVHLPPEAYDFEVGVHQRTPRPVYEDWLPFANDSTFTYLNTLTALEALVFDNDATVELSQRCEHVQSLIGLYLALCQDDAVRSRYARGGTWDISGKLVNTMAYPLVISIHRALSHAILYSIEIEQSDIMLEDRVRIHSVFNMMLACLVVFQTKLKQMMRDKAFSRLMKTELREIDEMQQIVRAYMFYNAGGIRNPLAEENPYKEMEGDVMQAKTIQSCRIAAMNYSACLVLLRNVPRRFALPWEPGVRGKSKRKLLNFCSQRDQWKTDKLAEPVAPGRPDDEAPDIGEATWTFNARRMLVVTAATLKFCDPNSLHEACGLARLANNNGIYIDTAYLWEGMQTETGKRVTPNDKESVMGLLQEFNEGIEKTQLLKGSTATREWIVQQMDNLRFLDLNDFDEEEDDEE
jgi:hypothetical protein